MPILTDEERVGTTIAEKYRLDRIIGRGGMGTVFGAVHVGTRRPVAVKFLRPDFANETASVRRFFQEARAAAALRHPNVVDVLDLGELADGGAYIVLELLQGEPLSARLQQKGRFSPAEVATYVTPLMRALAAAHSRGVVHRDIKPENVFLHRTVTASATGAREHDDAETVKLLDFGVAKMLDATRSLSTKTGTVVGTPHYMAPEQAEGRTDVGPACDVWSVGVMLYECLSGVLPFDAANQMGVLVAIMTRRPAPLAQVAPALSPALCAVVDRALRFEPHERWSSMAVFHDALALALNEVLEPSSRVALLGAVIDAPVSTPDRVRAGAVPFGAVPGLRDSTRRARRRALAVLAASVVLLALAATGLAFALTRALRPPTVGPIVSALPRASSPREAPVRSEVTAPASSAIERAAAPSALSSSGAPDDRLPSATSSAPPRNGARRVEPAARSPRASAPLAPSSASPSAVTGRAALTREW